MSIWILCIDGWRSLSVMIMISFKPISIIQAYHSEYILREQLIRLLFSIGSSYIVGVQI